MSNKVFNIMVAGYFDQLSNESINCRVGGCGTGALQGSLNNPLQAYRLLCLDVEAEASFESAELARITGVPSAWFESDRLDAPAGDVIKALGVLALVYLSCLRNEAMKYGFKVDAVENALEAENTLVEVLKVNKRLNSH